MIDFFVGIYTTFIYEPLLNLLILLYKTVPGQDLGVAIILLTILVRFVLYPLTAKAIRSQKKMADLKPKMDEIRTKFKDNKEKQTQAIFKLYKDEKINPLSPIFPILLQIPIFIAFFHLFSNGFGEEEFAALYSFVNGVSHVEPTLLGILALDSPSFIVALLAGAVQFVRAKQSAPKKSDKPKKKDDKPDIASMMQTQLPYILPLVIVFVVSRLPAAFGLYIVVMSLFEIAQYWVITRKQESATGKESKAEPKPTSTA